jgi:diaminopimelate epimerase
MPVFVKYQGLGNDFILVDRREGGEPVAPHQAIALCHRRLGVGADGVLTVLPSRLAAARMHVTNSDGSVAEMCGNGIRCVAKYLADEGLEGKKLEIETGSGVRACTLRRGPTGVVESVSVDMGRPELEAERIPMRAAGRFVRGPIELEGEHLFGTAVSMGNPHLVIFDLDPSRAARLGPLLERHPLFPSRTNVEMARVVGAGLEVAVWERGCGFTQACGTGACAAAVAAALEGRLAPGEEREVRLPGGVAQVRVEADLSRVFLRGPAMRVFTGEIDL